MQDNNQKSVGKFCIGVSAILLLAVILQYTVGEKLSLSNNVIDNYIHFGLNFNIVYIIFLLTAIAFIFSNKPLIKILSGLLGLILLIPVFLLGILMFGIIFRGEKANERHYFFNKDGYSYYITSERLMVFDGPEFRLYKEKPLFLFVKERLKVTDEEVRANNLDPDKITSDFIIQHF